MLEQKQVVESIREILFTATVLVPAVIAPAHAQEPVVPSTTTEIISSVPPSKTRISQYRTITRTYSDPVRASHIATTRGAAMAEYFLDLSAHHNEGRSSGYRVGSFAGSVLRGKASTPTGFATSLAAAYYVPDVPSTSITKQSIKNIFLSEDSPEAIARFTDGIVTQKIQAWNANNPKEMMPSATEAAIRKAATEDYFAIRYKANPVLKKAVQEAGGDLTTPKGLAILRDALLSAMDEPFGTNAAYGHLHNTLRQKDGGIYAGPLSNLSEIQELQKISQQMDPDSPIMRETTEKLNFIQEKQKQKDEISVIRGPASEEAKQLETEIEALKKEAVTDLEVYAVSVIKELQKPNPNLGYSEKWFASDTESLDDFYSRNKNSPKYIMGLQVRSDWANEFSAINSGLNMLGQLNSLSGGDQDIANALRGIQSAMVIADSIKSVAKVGDSLNEISGLSTAFASSGNVLSVVAALSTMGQPDPTSEMLMELMKMMEVVLNNQQYMMEQLNDIHNTLTYEMKVVREELTEIRTADAVNAQRLFDAMNAKSIQDYRSFQALLEGQEEIIEEAQLGKLQNALLNYADSDIGDLDSKEYAREIKREAAGLIRAIAKLGKSPYTQETMPALGTTNWGGSQLHQKNGPQRSAPYVADIFQDACEEATKLGRICNPSAYSSVYNTRKAQVFMELLLDVTSVLAAEQEYNNYLTKNNMINAVQTLQQVLSSNNQLRQNALPLVDISRRQLHGTVTQLRADLQWLLASQSYAQTGGALVNPSNREDYIQIDGMNFLEENHKDFKNIVWPLSTTQKKNFDAVIKKHKAEVDKHVRKRLTEQETEKYSAAMQNLTAELKIAQDLEDENKIKFLTERIETLKTSKPIRIRSALGRWEAQGLKMEEAQKYINEKAHIYHGQLILRDTSFDIAYVANQSKPDTNSNPWVSGSREIQEIAKSINHAPRSLNLSEKVIDSEKSLVDFFRAANLDSAYSERLARYGDYRSMRQMALQYKYGTTYTPTYTYTTHKKGYRFSRKRGKSGWSRLEWEFLPKEILHSTLDDASAKDVLNEDIMGAYKRMRRNDNKLIFTDMLGVNPGIDKACFTRSHNHQKVVNWSKATNLFSQSEDAEFAKSGSPCERLHYVSVNPKSNHRDSGNTAIDEIPDILHMIQQSKYDARKVHANAAANLGEKGAAAIVTNWARNAYGGDTSMLYMPSFAAGQDYDSEGNPKPTVMHSMDTKLQEIYGRTQTLLTQYEADRTALITALELGAGEACLTTDPHMQAAYKYVSTAMPSADQLASLHTGRQKELSQTSIAPASPETILGVLQQLETSYIKLNTAIPLNCKMGHANVQTTSAVANYLAVWQSRGANPATLTPLHISQSIQYALND